MIVGASNFPAQPAAWDSDVHGTFPTAPNTGSHIYFNDGIRNCASPRFVKIPIIAELDWASGPANLPPGNSDPVKIIGFYDAIITDPNETSDFKNPSDVLKTANVQVVWFGPDAHCVGPTGSTLPYTTGSIKTWRLVDQAA